MLQSLYFGESIQEKKRKWIEKKIEMQQYAKLKGVFVIVLYEKKETWFERISIKELERHIENREKLKIIGVIRSKDEFETFTLGVVEQLIAQGKPMTKATLMAYYGEVFNENT